MDLSTSFNEFNLSSPESPDLCGLRDIYTEILANHSEKDLQINTWLLSDNKSFGNEGRSVVTSSPGCNTSFSPDKTIPSPSKIISDSPEKSIISVPANRLSFSEREIKSIINEEKVAEFKVLLEKVNNAYLNWRINELILDTIKTNSASWAKDVKDVTKSTIILSNIELSSESGEVTNLLGLEDEDIKSCTSKSLSLINRSAFRDHVITSVKTRTDKLKLQKKAIQDEFGGHSMKARAGILSKERMELLELQRHVDDLQLKACQLLNSSQTISQQLATLRHNSSQHLQVVTYVLLQKKALYLHTRISTLKENLDQSLMVDDSVRKKMDSEGDNLKSQIMEKREELKSLQKTLAEYEKKEATSQKYKEIITEFGKVKKQLDHKNETLKMLNDPDMTF